MMEVFNNFVRNRKTYDSRDNKIISSNTKDPVSWAKKNTNTSQIFKRKWFINAKNIYFFLSNYDYRNVMKKIGNLNKKVCQKLIFLLWWWKKHSFSLFYITISETIFSLISSLFIKIKKLTQKVNTQSAFLLMFL